MAPRQLTHDDYTVGWLCVLDCELDVARGLLDEEDDSLPPGLNDDNTYLLGRIGRHNVVITCPESYGTSPAIQTVTNMARTFPRIRFGLMVGVGGGVPKVPHSQNSRKDLRLGDVVVAEPRGNHGGVIQYDLGKWKDNNEFVIESHLNKPPAVLLKAMKQLRADHRFGKGKMIDYMREVFEKMNDLPEIEGFEFPGRERDVLFNVNYAHVGGDGCSQCDVQHSENRIQRVSDSPAIHYGLIASGNAVMRSAKSRDELRDSHDVLCFEMEAAGLMNYFPCIVIRGICDYSDGHKNKQWQPYAAVAAATYAKDLLRLIHPGEVVNLEIAAEIIKEFSETISNVNTKVSKMKTVVDDDFKDKVLQWLTPIDYGHQQSEILSRREAGTGQWLLGSDEFQEWIKTGKQTLFCPGIQGAGKTVMSSIVIDYASSEYGNSSDVGIAYVYCSYRSKSQHKPTEILLSVLKQLTRGRQELPSEIKSLYVKHTNMGTRPKETEIVESLISVTKSYSRAFFIIDALDEHYSLDPGSLNSLLAKIFHIQENTSLSLFATSRDIPEITSQFNDCLSKEILARNDDILCFVDGHMSELCPSQISKFPEVQDLVRNTIIEAARGMFLLANLHMESLLGQPTIGDLEEALKELPCGESRLDDTYLQAVERIGNQRDGLKNLARRTLTWLTYSKRALSLPEIQHAFAVRGCSSFLDEKFIPDPGTLGSICAGLVIVDPKNGFIDFMHYTTKEYFERTGQFSEEMIDISTTCVTYLSLEVFNDGICSSNDGFDSRLYKNPLYDYAARNWGLHAQETFGEPNDLIVNFLSSEAKVSASCQAMMVDETYYRFFNRSQLMPRHMTGVHLAAYFGSMKAMVALLWRKHGPDLKDSHGRTPLSLAAENGHTAVVLLLLTVSQVEPDSKDCKGRTPLSWAAFNGHEDIILLLLETGNVDPQAGDNLGRTPLSYAAEQGCASVVWLLLNNNRVHPDSRDSYGRTPLSWAAEKGHETTVWLLLRNTKVDPDSMSTSKRTPLSWAAEKGHETAVWLLLKDRRVDPDSCSESKRTPLSWAVEYGHECVVSHLIADERVNPDAKDLNYGLTALGWAAWKGQERVLRLLLTSNKATLNYNDLEYKGVLLSKAAQIGHLAIAELLLTQGADPNASGCYAVAEAAHYGRLEVVQLLLKQGADVNAEDSNGGTPIHEAVIHGHLEVVRLLLDCGADVNTEDSNGGTPIHIAASKGHLEIVRLLLDRGADINAEDSIGWTPIHEAVFHGYLEVVRLLLDRGADMNTEDSDGWTPIHGAVSNSYLEVVRLLLDRGADMNTEDSDGWTPIHVAASKGHLEVVRLLLDRSADIDTINCNGLSPIENAAWSGHTDVVELLMLEIWSSGRECLFGSDDVI